MASNPRFAVRCRGLTKTYGASPALTRALRGVDLDVPLGELVMLMGPSGCGKTTLLSVIAALLDQDAGTCEVLGRNVASMNGQERARFRNASIGFVFQSFNLLPALSCLENVAVPLLIGGLSRQQAEARSIEMLDEVGLGDRAAALPTELSGGQQQRVAIARALVHRPSLLVCDEPTSSLDHQTGSAVMETLRAHARHAERTIIVVTHDSRMIPHADRVVHMEDGAIVVDARDVLLEQPS